MQLNSVVFNISAAVVVCLDPSSYLMQHQTVSRILCLLHQTGDWKHRSASIPSTFVILCNRKKRCGGKILRDKNYSFILGQVFPASSSWPNATISFFVEVFQNTRLRPPLPKVQSIIFHRL
jgi:hypothetical protein